MRGVLHTGHICAQQNGLLTVEAMDYNLDELPKSFGGMSGGGLWRIFAREAYANSFNLLLSGRLRRCGRRRSRPRGVLVRRLPFYDRGLRRRVR